MNNKFNFKINVTKTAESNYGCDIGNVTFSSTPTLRDLVDWVLDRGEWGYIGIDVPNRQSLFGDPHIAYSDGKITVGTFGSGTTLLDPFMDHVVQEVKWSGGWSRSDYLIKVVQANDLIKEKPGHRKEVPSEVSKYTFMSLDGTGVISCDNLDLVRPFKVITELQAESGPNISGTKYYARICDATTTTMELYKDLNEAMQVSKETYTQIIKLKQTYVSVSK